jgi:SAM-dependent methyltransferase
MKTWNEWNSAGGPRFPHEKILQFVFRNFPPAERRGVPALDLGCGSGVHTALLADEGFDVLGVDISPVGIENTRRRLTEKGLRASLAVQDLAVLELPSDRYKLVVCIGVLDSAGPAAARVAIPRVQRAMASGGRGVFVFASDGDFRVKGDNPYGLHGYTRAEVESVFEGDWTELFVDRYITTYRGGESEQNDWLITVCK